MPVIGIDLGTTNSVMAHMKRGQPSTIENADGGRWTPSVIGISQSGETLVGSMAKEQALMCPEDTIYSIKRFMGRNFADPDIQNDIRWAPYKVREADNKEVEVLMHGKWYTPQEISALILTAMKQEAERKFNEPVTHAVITVPAYFGTRQKAATREAGEMAGLKVMRVLAEPTAAALAYGFTTQDDEMRRLVVYDLGGGTFDVTVMMATPGNLTDLAKTGNNHLGGDDFDQKIMNYTLDQVKRMHGLDLSGNKIALQLLKTAAEKTKIALSNLKKASLLVPNIAQDNRGHFINVQLDVTRETYDDMIRPLVIETIELIHRAIAEANLGPDEIDFILLVGGSTLTPLVQSMLEKEFGRERVLRNLNPMECVAQGAAIQTAITQEDPDKIDANWPMTECPHCAKPNRSGRRDCWSCGGVIIADIQHLDAVSKPLGLQAVGDKMEVVVPQNTFYPTFTPITQRFRTTAPDLLRIPIYEGFEEIASKNEYLGTAEGPLPRVPVGSEVVVGFSIDADAILYVTAELPDRPDVKIKTSINWRSRPPEWIRKCQEVFNQANDKLNDLDTPLSPERRQEIKDLAAELQQAVAASNQALAERKAKDLTTVLEKKEEPEAGAGMLGFAKALIENYGDKMGSADKQKLQTQIANLEAAQRRKNSTEIEQRNSELVETLFSNPFGLLMLADIVGSNPDLPSDKRKRLTSLTFEAHQALNSDNRLMFNMAMNQVVSVLSEALDALPSAPTGGNKPSGGSSGNKLGGLLDSFR